MPTDDRLTGLTASQVAERVRRGETNRPPRSDLADYALIVRRNLLTLFNAMVVPAAIALFVLHEYQGAIAVSGMAIVNSAIGLVQEIRSKWHLDRLALLVEARARVVRDDEARDIPAGEVVRGDTVLLSAGAAVVADGPVVRARFLEVDEALLTGESDPVRRKEGDRLLSGSFCVAGEGAYVAERVGADAFANATTATARRYHYAASPLTRVINVIIEVLSGVAIGLCILYGIYYQVLDLQLNEVVKMVAATITSMVPQGLVLTATISFTLGAVRMSPRRGGATPPCRRNHGGRGRGLHRQDRHADHQPPATGSGIHLLTETWSEADVRDRLRLFASASLDRDNKNLLALRTAMGETEAELLDQIPFKSQNRYSAVRVRHGEAEFALVLGAYESLREHISPDNGTRDRIEARWKDLLPTGLRLLLFAETDLSGPFGPTLEGVAIRPLALVALSDELRPHAAAVLTALAKQGIAFKVVSGDNPEHGPRHGGQSRSSAGHEPVVTGDEFAAASQAGKTDRGA